MTNFGRYLGTCTILLAGFGGGCADLEDAPAPTGGAGQATDSALQANCSVKLPITAVAASSADAPTPASNAIDGSLATRWSAKGIGQSITLDLGQTRDLCGVGVAWYNGIDGRVNHYVISTSSDNVQFTQVLAGDSSGTTTAIEQYALPATVRARYVRVTVNGNTSNTWASITEIALSGIASDTTPPQTTLASSGPAQGTVQTTSSASFAFSSNEASARFECRLDGSAWTACASPKSYASLPLRVHTFEVRAIDAAGNIDATPERRVWTTVAATPGVVKPGPENTGVPAGTTLRRYDGDLVITTPGTVLDALDIHGSVEVRAANVRVTRCILRGGYSSDTLSTSAKPMLFNYTPTASFVVEDSEFVPDYPSIWLDGIRGMNFTARRVEISNTTDGIGINGTSTTNTVDVRVESSWIHDMRHVSPTPAGYQSDNQTHNDGIQYHYGNNARIVGNLIEGAHNAAMMISQTAQGTWDLEVRNNWLDDGACTVNLYHSPTKFTQMPPPGKSPGITLSDNRFGANANCAIYRTLASIVTMSNNTYEATGAPANVVINNL